MSDFISPDGWNLRDWFAGQALAGAIVNADIDSNCGHTANAANFARAMYHMADAMIEARNKMEGGL